MGCGEGELVGVVVCKRVHTGKCEESGDVFLHCAVAVGCAPCCVFWTREQEAGTAGQEECHGLAQTSCGFRQGTWHKAVPEYSMPQAGCGRARRNLLDPMSKASIYRGGN